MILFSTTLDTTERLTKDSFIKLLFKSIRESPYEENIIPNLEWHGERSAFFGNEDLSLSIEDYRKENIVAARYEKRQEDGAVWDTDYVFDVGSSKLAIRLERSYSEDALKRDGNFSTPYFIKYLIDAGAIAADGDLEIDYVPLIMDEETERMIEAVRSGNAEHRLPIILITAVNHAEELGDIKHLAHNLKGVAHVILKQEEKFESVAFEDTENAEAVEGAEGEGDAEKKLAKPSCTAEIFYPNNALKSQAFTHNQNSISDAFRLRIVNETIRYTNAQLVEDRLTWSGVKSLILSEAMERVRAEMLKKDEEKRAAEEAASQIRETMDEEVAKHKEAAVKEAKAEAREIIGAFDEEWNKLNEQFENMRKDYARVTAENQGLTAKLYAQGSTPIIYEGKEEDLYPGEIRDLVMSILEMALASGRIKGSRALDIINDVLESNESGHSNLEKTEAVVNLLNTYNRMEGPVRQELQDIGFEINEEGKHYKLKFYGDGRYTTTIAKTPSGGTRGAQNAAHEARGVLYVVEK